MFHLTETINEVGMGLRTMWAATNLEPRLTGVRAFSSRGLGQVLLDDRLIVDPATGLYYSIVLFQHIFLCCRERKPDPPIRVQYPLKAWEVGPALSASCRLGLVCAVPTKNFRTMQCIDKRESLSSMFPADGMVANQCVRCRVLRALLGGHDE